MSQMKLRSATKQKREEEEAELGAIDLMRLSDGQGGEEQPAIQEEEEEEKDSSMGTGVQDGQVGGTGSVEQQEGGQQRGHTGVVEQQQAEKQAMEQLAVQQVRYTVCLQ